MTAASENYLMAGVVGQADRAVEVVAPDGEDLINGADIDVLLKSQNGPCCCLVHPILFRSHLMVLVGCLFFHSLKANFRKFKFFVELFNLLQWVNFLVVRQVSVVQEKLVHRIMRDLAD